MLKELDEAEINDEFPEERLFAINSVEEDSPPWFADIANYLVAKVLPKDMNHHQKKKLFADLKHYF